MDPLEKNHKQRRFLIIAIVVVVGVLVALFFIRRGKGKGGDQYRTEAASQGSISANVNATGTLSAVITVQVGSQVSGIIAKLYADFNSQVKSGQLLAELDPTPFQQTVEQRQADVTKAKVDVANTLLTYNRQKRLAEVGLIAQSDLDAAKAAYDGALAETAQADAALKQAQTNLSYTKIYSPIDGQVVARQYDLGQTVAASFSAPTLFTIAKDLTKMQVQADVDQSDIGQISVGEPVQFTVDAYPDQTFRGQISQVRLNATVTQNVITYPVIVEVPNPDLKLRPSMTANVQIRVATVHDTLRVPNSALRFRPPVEEGKPAAGTAAAGKSGTQASSGPAAGQQAAAPAGGQAGGQTGQPGGRQHGGGPGGAAGGGHGGGAKRQQGQTVYVLNPAGGDDKTPQMRPVQIRTGITDGHYTQVLAVTSGTLNAGDPVIVGVATLKVETPGGANARPGAPPGRGLGGRF
ncbi:MAG TPA: efflux RND transporter periplasmic adaptor subunit [Thermoanaerobaculia bacterium]|jgi:HlyD family secretion protein|nr:efflux RND transporter periplasmic adaptor subunit [Thermoanaerobaculia bacterium]